MLGFRSTVMCVAVFSAGLSVASPIGDGLYHFEIIPTKDTVLTYESTYFEVRLQNTSTEPIIVTPFVPGRQFVRVMITNMDYDVDIQICGAHLTYVPDTALASKIDPGEERVWVDELLWTATCIEDTIHRLPHWTPGRHRAVFVWECDLRDWLDSEAGPYVVDTAWFVVKDETGRDRDALHEFLDARRTQFAADRDVYVDALWDLARRYPESPYAGEALHHLANQIGWGIRPPPSMDRHDFASRYARLRPYENHIGKYVRMALEGMTPTERVSFLSFFADTLPLSVAAKAATELLAEETDSNE